MHQKEQISAVAFTLKLPPALQSQTHWPVSRWVTNSGKPVSAAYYTVTAYSNCIWWSCSEIP